MVRRSREDIAPEIDFHASPGQIREFQENLVWRDIVAYFEDRIKAYHTKLEEVATVEDLRFAQGIISNARDLLDLPDQMIEWAEYEQDKLKGEDDG